MYIITRYNRYTVLDLVYIFSYIYIPLWLLQNCLSGNLRHDPVHVNLRVEQSRNPCPNPSTYSYQKRIHTHAPPNSTRHRHPRRLIRFPHICAGRWGKRRRRTDRQPLYVYACARKFLYRRRRGWRGCSVHWEHNVNHVKNQSSSVQIQSISFRSVFELHIFYSLAAVPLKVLEDLSWPPD
jgi:hypothetical protein